MATPSPQTSATTQKFLQIFDIRNNLVVLKSGHVSTILTINAINFGLLAEEEQDAVMYAYAGLLNSLNFPIQIVINSQTKDVTRYLSLLKQQEEITASQMLRHRIRVYREFVSNLIQERNVLDKKFYVVVPASGLELGFTTAKGFLPGQAVADFSQIEKSVIVERAKTVLDPRRDHLINQFARIGLYARELETQEIIRLFYVRYNPEAADGQQIGESSSYTAPLVSAQLQDDLLTAAGGGAMTDPQEIIQDSMMQTEAAATEPETPSLSAQPPQSSNPAPAAAQPVEATSGPTPSPAAPGTA